MPAPTITTPALLSIHHPRCPAVQRKPYGCVRGLLRIAKSFPIYGTSNTGQPGSQEVEPRPTRRSSSAEIQYADIPVVLPRTRVIGRVRKGGPGLARPPAACPYRLRLYYCGPYLPSLYGPTITLRSVVVLVSVPAAARAPALPLLRLTVRPPPHGVGPALPSLSLPPSASCVAPPPLLFLGQSVGVALEGRRLAARVSALPRCGVGGREASAVGAE